MSEVASLKRRSLTFFDMRLGRMRPMIEDRTVMMMSADRAPRKTW